MQPFKAVFVQKIAKRKTFSRFGSRVENKISREEKKPMSKGQGKFSFFSFLMRFLETSAYRSNLRILSYLKRKLWNEVRYLSHGCNIDVEKLRSNKCIWQRSYIGRIYFLLIILTGWKKITLVLLKSKYFQGLFDSLQKNFCHKNCKGVENNGWLYFGLFQYWILVYFP